MHAVRTTSPHPIVRVAFSPCGRWLAAAQPHHGVTLYDRATGAAGRTVGNARRANYTSLVFLRDGAWIAAAGSKGLEVFDAATGATVGATVHWYLCGLQLASRGDMVLAGGTRAVIELSFPSGLIGFYREGYWHNAGVGHYGLSMDGSWAVGCREGKNPVAIDLKAKRAVSSLSHPAPMMWSQQPRNLLTLTFAVPGARVAVGDGTGVAVYDLAPTDASAVEATDIPPPLPIVKSVFTLPPPDGWPDDQPWRPPLALTPDGRGLLVKRPRERVQLWDVDAGTLAAEWSWRLDGITCLAVAPDGLTAVAGARFGRVLMWDLG